MLVFWTFLRTFNVKFCYGQLSMTCACIVFSDLCVMLGGLYFCIAVTLPRGDGDYTLVWSCLRGHYNVFPLKFHFLHSYISWSVAHTFEASILQASFSELLCAYWWLDGSIRGTCASLGRSPCPLLPLHGRTQSTRHPVPGLVWYSLVLVRRAIRFLAHI